ncbi:MAG: single-stranded-DNA-specific exonuclease RecJ [Gammaproteobacteria bacterium]|nr:single-stranded-DNA-specific exonuclease RecJ [Gammaproteobacteria bacterium]
MNKTIISRNPKFDLLKTDLSLSQRILANRGLDPNEEIDYGLANLLSFELLKDIDKAVALLFEVIKQQQKILIVGDFDADGATSSALCKLVLQQFGAQYVDYLVPNRFDYGYGLSPELVSLAKDKNPDLIITVDNGISSIEGVKKAKSLGIKVLITDHHLAGDELPEADAIINPNQPDDEFPSKNLAGVGVVFYLLLALRAYLREQQWFEQNDLPEPNLAHYLDLVALGTVADLVPLDTNNRILVKQGLRLIKAGKARLGIAELLSLAKRKLPKVKSSDLGFAVGPRLNAAGRLDDMSLGIECLLAQDKATANEYAQILHSLNSDRQEVEQDMQQDALQILAEQDFNSAFEHSICLYQEHWHQGVVGLLASRVKDKLNKPCIVFANDSEETLKGSARSVKQVHIRDALALVNAKHPALIDKFGGHAMAAGLSLKKSNLPEFEAAFDQAVELLLNGKSIENSIETDGVLQNHELNLQSVSELETLGPFGQAFPEPLFHGDFKVLSQRIVGKNHLKLQLQPVDSNQAISAIAFRVEPEHWIEPVQTIRAAYQLDINDYYEQAELQLIIQYLEPLRT